MAFYKGLATSMFGITHAMANFTIYDFLKSRHPVDINKEPHLIILYSTIAKSQFLINSECNFTNLSTCHSKNSNY